MFGFQENQFFPCVIQELTVLVLCMWHAEIFYSWMKKMAGRGGWRSLSGLIREIVRPIGQGNLAFVREMSGNLKNVRLLGVFWYQSSTTLFLPVFLFKHVTSLLILRTYLHGKSAIVILTTTRFHRMTQWSNLVTIQLISRQRYLH